MYYLHYLIKKIYKTNYFNSISVPIIKILKITSSNWFTNH